jgi:protein-S-isoprenylcysteine O-methyltransferase Ste14
MGKSSELETNSTRGLFWASFMFYILIAFEFFYMASPFAAYFYSVYGPGLDGLQSFGLSGWVLWFYLPHAVAETHSSLINSAPYIGGGLFGLGLLSFCIAAFQVYRAKLLKSDAVMGGPYKYIRHPQYASLIVTGLGMLLIWPRFLVLFSTVTMIFAYIALARAEEAICLRKYPSYQDYLGRTGGFLPWLWWPFKMPHIQNSALRVSTWFVSFISVIAIASALAFGIRALTIASLYTHETAEGAYLSVVAMPDADLASVAGIARAAPEADQLIAALEPGSKILAYVLPTEMYVSEVPMHLPVGQQFGHTVPKNRDTIRYKVVFTKAEFAKSGLLIGGSIVAHAVNKRPLLEVQVNLKSKLIEATFPPPARSFYPDVQVPIF